MANKITGIMADIPTNINELPDEMLLRIFSYLSLEDLGFNIQFVCTHWFRLCLDDVLWKHLLFSIGPDLSDNYISSVLHKLPQLKCVEVFEPLGRSKVFHVLAECCKKLHKLKLTDSDSHWGMREDYIEALQCLVTKCTKLEELKIPGGALVKDAFAVCVGQLTSLRAITLTGGVIDKPIELKHIADGCPYLQHLEMCSMKWFFSDVKYFLEQKKNRLRSFGISHISVEGSSVFPLLAMCESGLYELQLSDRTVQSNHIAGPTFSVIKSLSHLTSLKIKIAQGLSADVFASIFMQNAMCQLLDLEIDNSNAVNGSVLHTICNNCPYLLRLRLSCCRNFNDDGLKYLHKCAKLEEVVLNVCLSLTDDVMDHVVKCTKLKRLRIEWCRLTEKGLGRVLELSELRHLDLTGCNVAGLPFQAFSLHLKKLTRLILCACRNIDTVALDVLRAEMHHLHVFQ